MENFEIRNIAKSEEIGQFEIRTIHFEIRNVYFESRTIMQAMGNCPDRTVYLETRMDQFEIRNINHSSFEPFNSKFEV